MDRLLAVPSNPETFHEMMDIAAESLQNKNIHEKCFAGFGDLVVWTWVNEKIEANSYTKKAFIRNSNHHSQFILKLSELDYI